MKKNLKQRVLDVLSSTQASNKSNSSSAFGSGNTSGTKNEPEIPENLTSDCFQLCKIVRHGFPQRPTAINYDPMQKLLAIGNMTGSIRLLGQPGVDIHVTHDNESPVVQLLFLINEGGLISVCTDNSVNLWNLRQKKPGILHSLKFNREKITFCHLPYQSKWLYIGSDRGNVHLCSVETFVLSGYVINWNKAIDLSQKTHPGYIVGICENPCDENRILIAFETGLVVMWDLKMKMAERRFYSESGIRSISWHHEGKQFMCSHSNGALSVWNYRNIKPQEMYFPHSRSRDSSKFDNFSPIDKVEWKSCRSGDPFLIFTGGLSRDIENVQPSVTVTRGKSTRVLEMDYNVVDFIAISKSPWKCDFEDPVALAILLEKELVVIDLVTNGCPTMEFPHPIDIHDSPVTCFRYFLDTSSDLTPGLYQVSSSKPRKLPPSHTEWPLDGGVYSVDNCTGFPEIMVTGHADGTIRFWDASAVSLRELYKLRTQKFFKKSKKESTLDIEMSDLDNFAINHIDLCPESRCLLISNVSGSVLFCELHRGETANEILSIELLPIYESTHTDDSPDLGHHTPINDLKPLFRQGSESVFAHNNVDNKTISKSHSDDAKVSQSCLQQQNSIYPPLLKIRNGAIKQSAGFQAELICQLAGNDYEPMPSITELSYCSAYGVFAIGTMNGVYLVDSVQKKVILTMPTSDILADKKRGGPKSPNRMKPPVSLGDIAQLYLSDQNHLRSPSALEGNESFNFSPGSRTPHKESSAGAGVPPPRPKNPPKRSSNKKGSFSFEKSLDSQSSVATDDGAFSRASSICDIDRPTSPDMITSLVFVETYARKDDTNLSSTLWIGTSAGTVYAIEISQPEQRMETSLVAVPTGIAIHMKGSIVNCAFLNSMGHIIPPASKNWKDLRKLEQQNSTDEAGSSTMSPDLSKRLRQSQNSLNVDKQFLVVTSEKQIKVFTLPAQSLMHVYNVPADCGCILRSEVAVVQMSTCILCHSSSGRVMIFSLPSLSPLLDVDYFPPQDVRITQTLCFTNEAQIIYMPTSSEVQRVTCSVEVYESIQEIIGHLFIPCEAPERPNPGFFKSLFGGGVSELDRQELFGEATSGKASKAVAKHIPGSGLASLEGLRGAAQHGLTEMQKLRLAALERGEKLSELEEKTQRMQESAQKFSNNAHSLMMKYKNKKWYQL